MLAAELPNIIGLIGVALILLAYFMLQIGTMSSETYTFSFINIIGSFLILYSLFYHWNLSSVVIEIAWIIISSAGVIRVMRKRKIS